MGKKSPSAPNPYSVAEAQGTVNADTARTQAALNRNNTVTPFGTVTNTQGGRDWVNAKVAEDQQWRANTGQQFDEAFSRQYWDERNPDRDQWTSTVSLSPDQQAIYEQGLQLDYGTGQLALDQLPQVRELLAQPYAQDDADARDRATAGIMSRLEPQFARDREGLESRLLAQGFVPGSEGYTRAADELNRTMTDARMQAVTAGLNESRQGAAFANGLRGQRVNELGMLFGLGPGMQQPQAQQLAPVGINAPDLAGAIQSQYQSRLQSQQATNANWFGLAGAALGAGGAYAGGMARAPRPAVGAGG